LSKRNDLKPGRRALGIAVGVLLAVAAPSAAADAPDIESGPTVSGTPQVGQALRGEAGWEGTPSWLWIRCDGVELSARTCREISGARARSYTVTAADHGKRLRVMLTVRHRGDSEWGISPPTAAVTAAPAPTPTPTPPADPTPEPDPPAPQDPPAQVPAPLQPAVPVPQGAVLPAAAAKPPVRMRPAPLVRIGGRLTTSGARITLLKVTSPRGARITLRCIGRGCPARRWAKTAAVTRIARFQRVLRAGTKLVITVTKPRRIGKHTTIVIRRGKAPARRDRCLLPGSRRPVDCGKVAT